MSPPPTETSVPTKNDKETIIGDLLLPVPLKPTEKTAPAVFNPYISAINYSNFEKKSIIVFHLIILEWIRLV